LSDRTDVDHQESEQLSIYPTSRAELKGISRMPKSNDIIFVLWGDNFEEAAATIFVTELREAGLRVKVVGLTPPNIKGSRGLALVPDLTLEQALPLAGQSVCLVIPCASPGIKRLNNDPRLGQLFRLARSNKAKFVVGQLRESDITDFGLLLLYAERVFMYPDREDLVKFARKLADSLLTAHSAEMS